ncbi:hypothetical protein FBU30_006737 [Linnemannia zychae]|nr:hypothetical protein FBU30_006737 [Linnemannia zychae]
MDVPEILQAIGSHLDNKSLVNASTVSRHWNTCLAPLIWSTIHPQDWTHPGFRPRTLYSNANLVRSLGWHATTSSVYHQTTAALALQIMAAGSVIHPSISQNPGNGGRGDSNDGMRQQLEIPSTLVEQVDMTSNNPFHQHLHEHKLQQAIEQNATKPADGSSQGLIASALPNTTATITPPISEAISPVLERLSLSCLTNIVGQCVNLQHLSLRTNIVPSNRTYLGTRGGEGGIHLDMISVLQSLVLLQSLELHVDRVVIYQCQNHMHGKGELPSCEGLVQKVEGGIVVQDLVRQLTQLSRLSLRGAAFVFHTSLHRNDPFSMSSSSTTTATDTFSIQHLTLDTPYISEQELSILLTQCPHLESLDLPGGLATWTWSETFLKNLRQHNSQLCAFSINASAYSPIPEAHLVALIRDGFCRPLRRFGARACQMQEGEVFLALQEQQQQYISKEEDGVLEELDISLAKWVGPLFKKRMLEFLNCTVGLKKLEASGVWIAVDDLIHINDQQQQQHEQDPNDENEDEELEAPINPQAGNIVPQVFHNPSHEQIQNQQQTMTTMQQQHQRFSRFASYKTLTHLHIGFTHPSRNGHLLQRMYTLLSTLTALTHLQLSYTNLNISVTHVAATTATITTATPDSGFRKLASLTRLREFNIETCGYRPITRPDIEWMVVKSWKRLEKLVLNQLGASQERAIKTWLRELGREDLVLETSRPLGMYI